MSVEVFCYRLGKSQLPQNDKRWLPRWLEAFAAGAKTSANGNLIIERQAVLDFPIRTKSGGSPVWQRLQSVRAVEWYQEMVIGNGHVDFTEFRLGFLKLVAKEKNCHDPRGERMPGEGIPIAFRKWVTEKSESS